jgi:hypothetical protein
LSAKLAATYSTQPWYRKITGITLQKKLGVPVVSVWVSSAGPDDQAYAQDEQILKTVLHLDPGMADVFETRDRWGSRVIVARQHSQLSPSPLPAPANAADVKTWLAKTYGPRGELPVDEPWYASIRSIAYDNQWRADALVVTTSLKDDAAGVEQAELIQAALRQHHGRQDQGSCQRLPLSCRGRLRGFGGLDPAVRLGIVSAGRRVIGPPTLVSVVAVGRFSQT